MPSSEETKSDAAPSPATLRAQVADLSATLEIALELLPDHLFDEFLCRLALARAMAASVEAVATSEAPKLGGMAKFNA